MKFFAFIMAVIVLTLSCMPCSDVGETFNNSKSEFQKSHSNESQKSDVCSPFCTCSCCSGFSINHFTTVLTNIPAYLANPTSSLLPSDVIKVALPIWQPPQLSA